MDRPVYEEVWEEQKARMDSETFWEGGVVRWAHIAILASPVFSAVGMQALETRLAQLASASFDEPTQEGKAVWEAIPTLEVEVRIHNLGIELDASWMLVTSTIRVDHDGHPGSQALEACAFRVASTWQEYLKSTAVRVFFEGRMFRNEYCD